MTVYTFHLRDGLKWSDGTPLTANDYVYSALRVLTPETTSQYVDMISDYVVNGQEYYDGTAKAEDVGIKALDDKTLEFTLKAPCSYYVDLVSMWVSSPFRKLRWKPMGTSGPMQPIPMYATALSRSQR